ncbi:MAG: aldo/keto reductase [Candidatus Heimdallarchaeota archaeon]|nr:aldo/keto reductase [Candidatus Heimdallarchaeota archaeon]
MSNLRELGVNLSSLGLGIEHFVLRSNNPNHMTREENSRLIIEEAFKLGLTHYDLVFNLPFFFDVFKEFIKNKRKKITFTTHFGSIYSQNGPNHRKSRSMKHIKPTFEGMLERIDTSYVDIALLQYITHMEDYEKFVKGGVLDYVMELKKEDKAKAFGFSAHQPELILKILAKKRFDVIMFPLNFATGILDSTKKLIKYCEKNEISIIAIKNLMKGKVFTTKKTDYPAYFCGGRKLSLKLEESSSPAQCLRYGLDQGAETVVFGVKTVEELKNNFESYKNEKDSVDYSRILYQFEQIVLSG